MTCVPRWLMTTLQLGVTLIVTVFGSAQTKVVPGGAEGPREDIPA